MISDAQLCDMYIDRLTMEPDDEHRNCYIGFGHDWPIEKVYGGGDRDLDWWRI